jgi:ionotropic glutamate receptor NMDA 3A
MTALAVALFEWLSPFGLNPWGRQRTKNFSMASALWVVWGRLFSHLVAFKVSGTGDQVSIIRLLLDHIP